ncbi:polysaccharide biosynthesis/export family protein [Hufsiella ginkgonis]|uniref:Capsule biosynthesis protein n=1 Tax=Hufsiella ginkgonis TaxID=2695274 RepID=A0A7K1Y0S3_9SPHI|nr:SLBB domain-containing protein [Hufsiella ginkgonis]MXV16688.1 capsule biosynthesis protein [Hufsiella ginkgonis]
MSKLSTLFLLIIFIGISNPSLSQVIRNLSEVSIDALSDNQLRQLLGQAQLTDLPSAQILKTAADNGLPPAEQAKLAKRLAAMRRVSTMPDTVVSRQVNNADTTDTRSVQAPATLPIFGANLFNGSSLTFEPNLRLATPANYVLGPDDQLNINISGKSVANWKLTVSPEGTINIPDVGIASVAGKTVEGATSLIRAKLNAFNYNLGNGSELNITLGNIRSIKILLVGEIVKPGTYTLPSLATIFNALYASGGPGPNGSLREIELIRNNRVIKHLDVYDFLLNGSQADNLMLKDQDIVRVPTYKVRVEITGEIKTPAKFEILPGETLKDVVRFAGGFTNEAYIDKIGTIQIIGQERQLVDVTEADYANYIPLRGDKFVVDRILDRFKNRVTINGAVFRPGSYALDKGFTLRQLITKASGLREGAFASRGFIKRLKPDNTVELVPFSPQGIISRTTADIVLQREDEVTIPNITDLRDEYHVTINGQVRKPGQFLYADSMTVEDLIIIAGGFTESASPNRIAVARRINNADPTVKNSDVAQVEIISTDITLGMSNRNFVLKPFDIVNVYTSPGFEKQRSVSVEGEVLYPGTYIIQKNNERISDLVKRAGGLTAAANVEGGALLRQSFVLAGDAEKGVREANIPASGEIKNEFVGISLGKILSDPASVTNIILEDGDILRIPKEQKVVHVNGAVLQNSAVVYEASKSFKQYILNAGGYSSNALKKKAYVVYPNGTLEGTRRFLFFNFHPDVDPGSTIFVPEKPVRKGLSTTELIGIGGTLISMAAIILSVFK